MPTIDPDCDVFTLINVFTVHPDRQQQLTDLLVNATEETMRHLPGFVSASIHTSHDGTRVVNYAQWQSREDFEAMLDTEAARPHMERAEQLAESYDPIPCNIADAQERAQSNSCSLPPIFRKRPSMTLNTP